MQHNPSLISFMHKVAPLIRKSRFNQVSLGNLFFFVAPLPVFTSMIESHYCHIEVHERAQDKHLCTCKHTHIHCTIRCRFSERLPEQLFQQSGSPLVSHSEGVSGSQDFSKLLLQKKKSVTISELPALN